MNQNADNLIDVSVVIPVYNEEDNLPALHRHLKEVLAETDYCCELIFVDDGSQDRSLQVLRDIREVSSAIDIRIVQLSRNFGQHPALNAGFSTARGSVIATIDADLQIDPGHIPAMVDKIHSGYDFVSGIRRGRGDSFLFRRLPSRALNLLIGAVIGKKLRDYNCPLNVMRAEIVQAMREYGEMQRFFKPLAVRLARRIAEVEVRHDRRMAGVSKYSFLNLVDLFFDFVTNFSKQFFQKVAIAGFGLFGINFLIETLYLILRFPLSIIPEPLDRLQATALIGFIFGVQLLIVGVLGDFVIRIYRKIDSKPLYIIKKVW